MAPSRIVTQPTDTYAAAPFSATFTCSVRGYGYQNITWYKQPGALPYKHEINRIASHGIVTSILIIPNVTAEDVGKYYCQVWANYIGVRSKTANLYYSGMHVHNYVTLITLILICAYTYYINKFMII